METTLLISVGIGKALGIVASVAGSIIAGAWWLSGRLKTLETKVEGFDTRLTTFEGIAAQNLIGRQSPLSLLPKGEEILVDSGLKRWIDKHKDDLIGECNGCDTENPYDIQEAAFRLFDKIDFMDFESEIKLAAFNSGIPVNVMRRIGGIYFRDIFLEHCGHKKDDVDRHDPNKKEKL